MPLFGRAPVTTQRKVRPPRKRAEVGFDPGRNKSVRPPVALKAVHGRLSYDDTSLQPLPFPIIAPPPDYETDWFLEGLDVHALQKYSPWQLLQKLADVSPDVSGALWSFLRFCNPGYEIKALIPGTQEVDVVAQQALDKFLARLQGYYGSVDLVINRLFLAAYMRGAFLAEIPLDAEGREPIDLVCPDPASIRFQRIQDPAGVRGSIWQMGQWQVGGFIVFDSPTIRYLPVDPMPASPYGRPLVAPALFSVLFLIGLLHDLKRVVQQQGYPRIDVAIDVDKLRATMPPDLERAPDAWKQWVVDTIKEVQAAYDSLEPDDAFVHTTVTEIGRPVGTVDATSLGGIGALLAALEAQATRALKMMPFAQGTAAGASEANANRQWEVQAAGIKALQHLAEHLLGYLLTTGLRAQGILANVQCQFAELRASEMLRDAQTQQLQIANAQSAYNQGWINQDRAAHDGYGVDKADQPEPRIPLAPPANAATDPKNVADPGANRQAAS